MNFLTNLYSLISKRGITKNKFCTELGLSKNTFINWEKRGNVPDGEVLAKIAEYFSVSVDYLLGKSNNPDSEVPKKDDNELPPDFVYSFYEGYREIDDDDRAILHNLMEKMRIAKKAKDSAQSTP